MTNNRGRTLPAKPLLLPLLTLGFIALCLAAIGVSRLLYPFDTGHYEGGIWMPAQYLAAGHNPYTRSLGENPPYFMAPYGPVYYAIIGAGLRLWGAQFWFGRALSFAACFVCAGCIAVLTRRFDPIARHRAESRQALLFDGDLGWMGAAFFLASLPVQFWIGMQRPDFLALAFSLLGLTLTLQSPASTSAPNARRLSYFGRDIAAALLMATAVLCRQTTFLPIVIACVWHGMGHRPWRALRFACLASGPVLGCVWALDVSSGGGFWWQSVTLAASVGKSWSNLIGFLTLLACIPTTIITALLCVAGLWAGRAKPGASASGASASGASASGASATIKIPVGGDGYKLLWIYLILAAGLAMVTSARRSADINYFLEVAAAASMVAPLSWRRLRLAGRASSKMLRLGCFALVTAAGAICLPLGMEESNRWRALPYLQSLTGALHRLTRPDEASFSVFPELIHAAGRRYEFNDWVQYDGRSPKLRRVFVERLHSQKLGALILPFGQKPPPGYQLARAPLAPRYVLLYVRNRFTPAQVRDAFTGAAPGSLAAPAPTN